MEIGAYVPKNEIDYEAQWRPGDHRWHQDQEIAACVGHCATQNGDGWSWATKGDIYLQKKLKFSFSWKNWIQH